MSRLRASGARFVRPHGLPDGCVVSVFRVPPEVAGQRLDVFLQSQLHRTSRTRTQFIVRSSAFDALGQKLKSNDRVQPEQHILLWRPPWDETPVPVEVETLYEDDDLWAVNKPANLPVHPTARYHHNTLIKILQLRRPGEFLSLGHRLDRETSGVILLTKTVACDRSLKRQLEQREGVEKTYVAFTWGVPDRGDGAQSFRFERGLEFDPTSRYKVKMCASDGPNSLYSATGFTVEARAHAPGDPTRPYARIRCDLETGRQHQIRVHLATLGAPIVGDKLYGPDESLFARAADGELTPADEALLELPRHALHAAHLSIAHPITGERLSIDAPLPEDLTRFWRDLTPPANASP